MFPANYKIVEGHSESTALFASTPTNTAVQSQEELIFRPVSQLAAATSCLEFNVPPSSKYLDLTKTRLYVQVKITRQDGSPLQADDQVGLVNLSLQSLFGQTDVSLNQIPINKIPSPLQAYKSYIDVLLGNGEEPKETWLQGMLWYADYPGFMDSVKPVGNDADSGLNVGLVARHAFTKGSRICEMEGPLYVDFFQQSRYLLNNIALGVRLWQAPDAFRLMADDSNHTYKVQIVDAALKLTAVTVTPEIILAHENCLTKSPAIYPFFQSNFKVYSIAQNDLFFSADNLWDGNVPSKALIMLVSSEAFNGSYRKNPYYMQHAHLNNLSFSVDGVSKPASKPLTPDFENDRYTEAFMSLFTGSNMLGHNTGNDISLYAYKRGYTIYSFDLDGHHSKKFLPLPKRAHIRIEAKFAKPLKEAMTVIVYGKFAREIKIDQSRNVFM